MSTLTLRTVKGTPLTNAELDANFTNILVAIGGTNTSPYTLPTATGTGNIVLSNSPTLVTPSIGAATATSVNKVVINAVSTGAGISIADTKLFTVNNTLTFSGTDSSSIAFGAGGTVAYTSNKLSTFASTTSAELLGVISDETGTGSLVFNNAPTFVGTVTIPTLSSTTANITTIAATSATFSGAVKEHKSALGANDINLSSGNYFSKTISTTTTLTVSNVPSSDTVASFILDLTNGGSATITWWTGIKWASGTTPTLTAAGRDILGFFTHDGGTTWNGLVLAKDVK